MAGRIAPEASMYARELAALENAIADLDDNDHALACLDALREAVHDALNDAYEEGWVMGESEAATSEEELEAAWKEWKEELEDFLRDAWRELAPPIDRFCDWRKGDGLWDRLAEYLS